MNENDQFLKENSLKYLAQIGSGTYGSVYLVYSMQYRAKFALKVTRKKYFKEEEFESLQQLDSPNVVRLYKCERKNTMLYLLMEYCPFTVFNKIKINGEIKEKQVLNVAYDILQALCICHSRRISHGDIKPNNIIIDGFGRAKLCDFGMSITQSDSNEDNLTTQICGSFPFAPPEIYLKKTYDRFKADIYSFGVTVFALLTGKLPFKGKTPEEAIANIINGKFTLRLVENQDIADLIFRCMHSNPEKRPNATELINHPAFGKHITPPLHPTTNIRLSKTKSHVSNYHQLRIGSFPPKNIWSMNGNNPGRF
ncbi:AGC family protein kinase [Trichomonas vaginalis G3]|uniref:AGC family protein kinase n=1 Tax=Trichomonas vaginalis (strain ATCC PRA-98 / G3) TaxID=412133 RepID=A2EY85_TRIV3|nr:histone serine kinase protein [Trichomonas vaginalis G3]EAY02373.1 AGC family protein kinase [Trichomonas vaginalis G3]KAI5501204.1 histone serine kinase protein [Trichomonas vaginalis G3]|eukprot:XP_001330634.1 AGC family protein kinase [Trichomonas vaginalis G3]